MNRIKEMRNKKELSKLGWQTSLEKVTVWLMAMFKNINNQDWKFCIKS